ncbi:hypothetical protein C8J57DRAFT_1714102 [Mycena rebaudengoi]|nr:hypothetical protein C8J57DRAFT_1714102 [Mycena rebaudengoi]
MAPAGWATEAEKTFLFLQLPDYIQRAAAGKLALFWGSVFEGFLQKFPERAKLGLPSATETGDAAQLTPEQRTVLENAIKARKRQIETWFRYQRRKITNASTATASTNSQASLASTLFTAPVRHRSHKAIEIFQKRRVVGIREALTKAGYDELDVANIPDDFTGADGNNSPEARAKLVMLMRMQLRARVVREMFDAISAEEKASIDEELEAEREKALKEEAEMTQNKNLKTPAALQKSIDELTGALGKVLNIAEKESGWVAMTIIGGPNPRMGGELSAKVVCTGETPTGNDFETFFPNFDGVITEEFFNFLRAIFPADVRAARALPTDVGESGDVMKQLVDSDAADAAGCDQAGESESTPKATKVSKKSRTRKKTVPTVLVPAMVEATVAPAGGGMEDMGLVTASMDDVSQLPPMDSDDPFLDNDPFPGASLDSFAALESVPAGCRLVMGRVRSWTTSVSHLRPSSALGTEANSRPSSDGSAGVESSMEMGSFASAFSAAATPPASSLPMTSPLGLSPSVPSPALSASVPSPTLFTSVSSPALSPSAPSPTLSLGTEANSRPSSDGSAGVESSMEMGSFASAFSAAATPPASSLPMTSPLGLSPSVPSPALSPSVPSPAPSPSAPSPALSGKSPAIQWGTSFGSSGSTTHAQSAANGGGFTFNRLPSLFEAFKGKNTRPLGSAAFSFPPPPPPVTPPWPTPTSSLPPASPHATSKNSSSTSVSSEAPSPSTPARQPTRAAQRLTSFLSPERRAGASQTATGAAPLPATAAQVPPLLSASTTVGNGVTPAPALPKSRPAAKRPVEKTARPVPKRRGRPTMVAVGGKVFLDATNGAVASTDSAKDSTALDAVVDGPPSQNASATIQVQGVTVSTQTGAAENNAAEPPPPEEKKREGRVRRAPLRADGTAAVGWKKRTSDEMNADTEGPTPRAAAASRKRRKTSAA